MSRKLKQNWIMSYAEGIDPFTEAPTAYCIWAAISVVGAVLKKHVWRKRGTFTIYPNQYIVLTGPPGVGKGEAIHPVYNIARDLGLCNIMSDRITAPKIIEKMANGFAPTGATLINGAVTLTKDSTAVLFSTELQTLLTSSDMMLQFLCDAWDKGTFEYDTKNSGSAFVRGMCTSLIGACVPEYIRKLNKDAVAAINGGFTARTIFVYAEAPSKRLSQLPAIEDSAKGKQLIANLKDDLQEIANLRGEYKMSPQAQWQWDRFYNNIQIKDDDSDVVMHFKRRMPVHVLKLAMVWSASFSDSLCIEEEDMINAIKCLSHVERNLDKAFRGVGESELAESSAKVQNFIERKGITTRQEILKNLHRHITSENLDRVLGVFSEIGIIKYVSQGGQQKIHSVGNTKNTVVNTNTVNFNKTGKII